MTQETYTSEVKREILEAFQGKGWNLYDSAAALLLGPDEAVRRGPAETLEVGTSYTIFPAVDNPRDPGQVIDALLAFRLRRGGKMPTMRIEGGEQIVLGITLEPDFVRVHTPTGSYVDNIYLIEALETLTHAHE